MVTNKKVKLRNDGKIMLCLSNEEIKVIRTMGCLNGESPQSIIRRALFEHFKALGAKIIESLENVDGVVYRIVGERKKSEQRLQKTK